ncbi:MAG: transcription antitermination factor NusB [Actinobacteria bacterium]|nr:transcription antitermination factor NusB [Actinomycetota bacterium]NDC12713.1 transcription antitermination factor NusB [Actinomycetota bacterium]NDC52259.1 transcription antitermination factor NusB [Actinomycetota bacterium]NDF42136.1 transcription antitermination factor NusB [Actinomycetota bacterium]
MSARSKARKAALDLLYEADIRGISVGVILSQRLETLEYLIRDYTRELLTGVVEHRSRIDELIVTYSQGWDFDRMPVLDRNILRLSLFELLWGRDIPEAVAIDEALELAKTLSTEESSSYIHGVLATISKIKADLVL